MLPRCGGPSSTTTAVVCPLRRMLCLRFGLGAASFCWLPHGRGAGWPPRSPAPCAVRAVGRCGRVGGLSVAEASTLEMPLRVAARLESPALFLVVLVALIRRGRVPRASSPCLFPGPILLLALWWPQPRGAQVLRRHRLRSGERALWTSALLVAALCWSEPWADALGASPWCCRALVLLCRHRSLRAAAVG